MAATGPLCDLQKEPVVTPMTRALAATLTALSGGSSAQYQPAALWDALRKSAQPWQTLVSRTSSSACRLWPYTLVCKDASPRKLTWRTFCNPSGGGCGEQRGPPDATIAWDLNLPVDDLVVPLPIQGAFDLQLRRPGLLPGWQRPGYGACAGRRLAHTRSAPDCLAIQVMRFCKAGCPPRQEPAPG